MIIHQYHFYLYPLGQLFDYAIESLHQHGQALRLVVAWNDD
jgi:hypothetical protein